jgi:phenylpropionate dioxygenase-like ring-hydroxylating dioxygenase large terminal subunit
MGAIDDLALRSQRTLCKIPLIDVGMLTDGTPDGLSRRKPGGTLNMPENGSKNVDFQYARRIIERTNFSVLPVKDAELLPAETYVSEKFWEFEKHAIFNREWLCVAHVNEVPSVGDYLPLTVMGEPLVVVRDETRKVRALSAICRHRGHPLVGGVMENPHPGACLNGSRLICPYHNWVYGLDGRLLGAPSMSETTPVTILREQTRLPEIRSEIFHGLVFINFHGDPPALAPALAKLDREFLSYGLKNLIPGHVFAQESLKWNWKLHHENALEPYHTAYVHKGFHDAVPSNLTEFLDFGIGDGQVMRTTGFLKTDGDLFEESGNRRLPDIQGLTHEQRERVLFVSIMPCAVAVLQPSFVTVTFLNPVSAGVLNSRRINLYSKAATETPEFDRIRQEQFDHMKIIIMQDQVTQAALQEAYHSRYMPPGRLSYLETAITQLNTWVVDKYKHGLKDADAA